MSRKLTAMERVGYTRAAMRLLCNARDHAKDAGCPRLVSKIRSAIRSAGGALRHRTRMWKENQ